MAYLHQAGVIAKNQDASLDSWARDYFLASEADRYDSKHTLLGDQYNHPTSLDSQHGLEHASWV